MAALYQKYSSTYKLRLTGSTGSNTYGATDAGDTEGSLVWAGYASVPQLEFLPYRTGLQVGTLLVPIDR